MSNALDIAVKRIIDYQSPLSIPADSFVALKDLVNGGCSEALLADLSAAASCGEIEIRFPPHQPPVLSEPGRWNLVGDQRFASEHPKSWDYLAAESPNFGLKHLQRCIYVDRFQPWLEQLAFGAAVLDMGGGIGRFALEWLERGHAVTLCDANEEALVTALGHLARQGGRFGLWHLSAEDLHPFEDEQFWAVSALELFCYLSCPEEGMREAARVLKPGGLLLASVESPVGSLDPGRVCTPEDAENALKNTENRQEGDLWVRYFTQEGFKSALEGAGFVVEAVFGTHYLPDGPLHRLLEFDRFADPAYVDSVLKLERLLNESEQWGPYPRAWTAVARKP
jgi:ubiquinone/menaquinone biosynthesis C-methylase UbiE